MKAKKGLALMLSASIGLSLLGGMVTSAGAAMTNGTLSWDFETENDIGNMSDANRSQGSKALHQDLFNSGAWTRVDASMQIVNSNTNSPYGITHPHGSPHRIKYSMIGGAVDDLASKNKDTNTFAYNDNACQSYESADDETNKKKTSANRTPAGVKSSGDENNNYCAVVSTNQRWSTEHEGQYYILGMNIQLTDEQLIPGREYELTADVLSMCQAANYNHPDAVLLEGTDNIHYTDMQRYVWTGFGKPSKRSEEFASTLAVKPGWALNKAGYGTGKVVSTNLANGKTSGTQWSKIKTTVTADPSLYENGAVALYIGISPYNEETLETTTYTDVYRREKVYFDNIKLTPVEESNTIVTNEAKIGRHWDFEEKGGQWQAYTEGMPGAEWKALKEPNSNDEFLTVEWNDVPHSMHVTEAAAQLAGNAQWSTMHMGSTYGLGNGTPARNSNRCILVAPGAKQFNAITGVRYVIKADEWMSGDYTLKLYGANNSYINTELHAALFKGDTEIECVSVSSKTNGDNHFDKCLAQYNAIKAQFDSSNPNLLADYKLGGLQKYWGYYTANINIDQDWLDEDDITLVIYARFNDWSVVPADLNTIKNNSFAGPWNNNAYVYLDEISLIYDDSTALDGVTTANVYQRMVSDKNVSDVASYLAIYDDDNNGALSAVTSTSGVVRGVSHRNLNLAIDENVGWPIWKAFTWNSNLKPYNSAVESE